MNTTLAQILSLVGVIDDSPGKDNSRERFRRFLKDNAKDVSQLRDYIQECLTPHPNSGPQYNRALQDLVNHVGIFLGFEVEFGLYQGVQGQNGFDGHWNSPRNFHSVTETKTTDTYAIKTANLLGYIDRLISEKRIPNRDNALGLYVIGRPDAGLKQLENSIIAENLNHQLRVISIDSLLSLAEVMSKYTVTHQDILDILRPSRPRVDEVVDLIARVAAESSEPPTDAGGGAAGDAVFWLTSVKSTEDETAEECIKRLVGEMHFYAFGERAAGRQLMKAGHRIAFYATTKGVVAHATLASAPQKKPRPDGTTVDDFPWVCTLKDASLYLGQPVAIDAKLRLELKAFEGKKPDQSWAWFVQATHRITSHDFDKLTRAKKT
jgi:hypothetical protein